MPSGTPEENAEYMRGYRESSDYGEKNRNRNNARRRAQIALANKHPAEFEALFSAQLSAMRNKGMKV